MITNIYILICIIVWIYIRFISQDDPQYTALKIGAMYPPYIKERNQWWRIITCHFIHVEFFHLFMNIYCIYFLGNYFESLLGEILYAGLLIFTMIIAGLTVYIVSFYNTRDASSMTIGASGVFYGYLGAMIGLALFAGGDFVGLLRSYAYCIIINVGFTLLSPGISKAGHLGGLLGGYFYMFILYLAKIIG